MKTETSIKIKTKRKKEMAKQETKPQWLFNNSQVL